MRMTRFIPAPRLLWIVASLATVLLAMLIIGIDRPLINSVLIATTAVLLLATLMDAALTRYHWRKAAVTVSRRLPSALALGAKRWIQLRIELTGNLPWQVQLFDHCDATLHTEALPVSLTLHGGQHTVLDYAVTPTQRGEVRFEPAALRVRSRWRLLDMNVRCGVTEILRVYPDFAQLARYAWLAGDHRLAEIGIKTYRQRGEGTDFKQLAEYRIGDSVRHIDWKATQRSDKLIVRQFQNERDQAVVFLIDCGRRLRADDSQAEVGGSHFDQVLNAVMLLSYVALKQGDAVGAMTFGAQPGAERWYTPRKGRATLNALMSELYAVEPTLTHSDYTLAARDLLKRYSKRALVVVITNFREEDATELSKAIGLLRTRHLVLTASLRERVVRELIEQSLDNPGAALDIAGAHWFEQGRKHAFAKMSIRNSLTVDAEPERLGVELVNRYHAVKRAGMI